MSNKQVQRSTKRFLVAINAMQENKAGAVKGDTVLEEEIKENLFEKVTLSSGAK